MLPMVTKSSKTSNFSRHLKHLENKILQKHWVLATLQSWPPPTSLSVRAPGLGTRRWRVEPNQPAKPANQPSQPTTRWHRPLPPNHVANQTTHPRASHTTNQPSNQTTSQKNNHPNDRTTDKPVANHPTDQPSK